MQIVVWAAAMVVAIGYSAAPTLAQTAKAELKDAQGAAVGTVELNETPAGVLLAVSLENVAAGAHGFHIHAVGKCEGPAFTSAGGHFNPRNHKHGMMSKDGHHAGDLPNLHVPQGGRHKAEMLAPGVTLRKGQPHSLMDEDGASVVLHAGPDDHKSDPAGESGARIACGVVQ